MSRSASRSNTLLRIKVALVLLCALAPRVAGSAGERGERSDELEILEEQVRSLKPDSAFKDDSFILATLQEALAAKREGSGGIGACLVREATGEIVVRGHNRQYSPYFRSDMHAEMDLMNRYDATAQVRKSSGRNPRQVDGLVLYTSVEPCPMCLTRIINTGVKKTYWAADDPEGGMGRKIDDLPEFWRKGAKGRIYAGADCSPVMKEIAFRMFKHGMMQSVSSDPE